MSVDLSKRSTSFVQFVSTAILIQRNCALWEFKQFSSKGTVPSWWIMQQSHHLEVLTASLVGETIKANSIFSRVKADIKQRASHIQSAISLCFEIVQHIIVNILSLNGCCNLGDSLVMRTITTPLIRMVSGHSMLSLINSFEWHLNGKNSRSVETP